VVIHLPDAPLADGAVVRALGLDAAALGTLEDHLRAIIRRHKLLGAILQNSNSAQKFICKVLTDKISTKNTDKFINSNGHNFSFSCTK
jgi:hypothetical protein